jgi:hypothetical protein
VVLIGATVALSVAADAVLAVIAPPFGEERFFAVAATAPLLVIVLTLLAIVVAPHVTPWDEGPVVPVVAIVVGAASTTAVLFFVLWRLIVITRGEGAAIGAIFILAAILVAGVGLASAIASYKAGRSDADYGLVTALLVASPLFSVVFLLTAPDVSLVFRILLTTVIIALAVGVGGAAGAWLSKFAARG